MRDFIKSLIFNILFYGYMALGSFALVWVFALPRRMAVRVVRWYFCGVYYIEKWVLGLDYRVEGLENLPKDGRYVLAMKHQSAYETLKLLPIFGNVAIALKRELTWIPLWGWYTLKTGMIPIDRGAGGRAMASLLRGAKEAIHNGRPILIYPQGTRTPVGASPQQYPYKAGVARMAQALGVPIVPVALNSGCFWAKKAFIKHKGTVTFRVLPPISSAGKIGDILSQLESQLETHSNELQASVMGAGGNTILTHAPQKAPALPWVKGGRNAFMSALFLAAFFAVCLAGLWAGWWMWAANNLRQYISQIVLEGVTIEAQSQPQIYGFPLQMVARWPDVGVVGPQGRIDFKLLIAKGWPVPGAMVHVAAPEGMVIAGVRDGRDFEIRLNSAFINIVPKGDGVEVRNIDMRIGTETKMGTGTGMVTGMGTSVLRGDGLIYIPLDSYSDYGGEMALALSQPEGLVQIFSQNGLVDNGTQTMLLMLLQSYKNLQQSQTITLDVRIHDNKLYAGMFRVFKFARSPKPLYD